MISDINKLRDKLETMTDRPYWFLKDKWDTSTRNYVDINFTEPVSENSFRRLIDVVNRECKAGRRYLLVNGKSVKDGKLASSTGNIATQIQFEEAKVAGIGSQQQPAIGAAITAQLNAMRDRMEELRVENIEQKYEYQLERKEAEIAAAQQQEPEDGMIGIYKSVVGDTPFPQVVTSVGSFLAGAGQLLSSLKSMNTKQLQVASDMAKVALKQTPEPTPAKPKEKPEPVQESKPSAAENSSENEDALANMSDDTYDALLVLKESFGDDFDELIQMTGLFSKLAPDEMKKAFNEMKKKKEGLDAMAKLLGGNAPEADSKPPTKSKDDE